MQRSALISEGLGLRLLQSHSWWKILDKASTPTPETLEDLVAWLDSACQNSDYRLGLLYECARGLISRTGWLKGSVPFLTSMVFMVWAPTSYLSTHRKWYQLRWAEGELLADQGDWTSTCIRPKCLIGTGNLRGGGYDYHWPASFYAKGVRSFGRWFGYMTTIWGCHEGLNNWGSLLAPTGNMVRYVIENQVRGESTLTGTDARYIKRAAAAVLFAREKLLSVWICNLAQGHAQYPVPDWSDVISPRWLYEVKIQILMSGVQKQ